MSGARPAELAAMRFRRMAVGVPVIDCTQIGESGVGEPDMAAETTVYPGDQERDWERGIGHAASSKPSTSLV